MLFEKRRRMIERLLIVEDEPLVAFDSEHVLTEAGYKVVATVDRVADALQVIAAEPLDLVLADVTLSDGGDGLKVAEAAKKRNMLVLLVTASCPIEAQRLAIGWLAKPYRSRDLVLALASIEAMLGGRPRKRLPRGLTLYGTAEQ